MAGLERQKQLNDYSNLNGGIPEELRGFALSPAQPLDLDYSQSTSHRGDSQRGDSSHRGGFDDSHTEETELYQPVTQVV